MWWCSVEYNLTASTSNTWSEFKRVCKYEFKPGNAKQLAGQRYNSFSKQVRWRGMVRSSLMPKLPNMDTKDVLFNFVQGLKYQWSPCPDTEAFFIDGSPASMNLDALKPADRRYDGASDDESYGSQSSDGIKWPLVKKKVTGGPRDQNQEKKSKVEVTENGQHKKDTDHGGITLR
ncbi:hypothetical protein INT45_010350 [Circinella minor]|uniref:Uncharacterized protein n=1 Tax=Circinella minor TaxID=1195481 RepID=A0A8H7SCI2_9FUNG|nr:hypothetical protein INT45_010350 [Circinella minor]